MKQVHLSIYGRVHGVGYRYFSQMKAIQYGIKGWVRNCDDGSVEMIAEGTMDMLKEFIEDIKKGNPFSTVDNVIVTENTNTEGFHSFKIKY